MDITYVVNDKAEGKRELICLLGESSGNLLVVCGACVITSVCQHAYQSIKSCNEISRSCFEAVLAWVTTLVVIGDVNKVPA